MDTSTAGQILHYVLFFLFGGVCVIGALNMVLQRHPINSALSLIVVMASLGVIYLLLGAPLISAVQIIVYAGAIMVLFVFVIMLLNAGEEERDVKTSRVATLLGVPGVAVIVLLVSLTIFNSESDKPVYLGGFNSSKAEAGPSRAAADAAAVARRNPNAEHNPENLPANESGTEHNPLQVSNLMFTNYVLPFEVTGILLLIAIMGAVVLTRRGSDEERV